ncbi:hypothetical protein T02_5160 [Trichinella nativa]|uniref:Uncharacterized protein n=1 Tax=Trichinella nativa TaxID=6335 RepID=A0A0V1KPN6_9BILA|nr:hypothetical protein T06_8780 [Trichinella sp. T6]KRX79232.1 hypothetical protein T06_11532 [Trichinella sp. T6]KRZ49232.1 hypothetical protein T02_5160 [Trichinella nativa]KRZ87894.1 hypothetical protein T08_11084 [Trichinella sp. T8]
MSGQGNENGNREHSSTTVNIYRLLDVDGSGPLKLILIRSKGAVALISFPESPLKNRGFPFSANSARGGHPLDFFHCVWQIFASCVVGHTSYSGMTQIVM